MGQELENEWKIVLREEKKSQWQFVLCSQCCVIFSLYNDDQKNACDDDAAIEYDT